MARRIEIFDTTLRDGNKLPFAVLSGADRLLLAHQLARLRVDVIEAGFPAGSTDEAQCVAAIGKEIRGPRVAALARALPSDVDVALESLGAADRPCLHIYMAVSPQFLKHVLKLGEAEAIRNLASCVRTARSAGVRTQFSLSEAPHARREFLHDVVRAAREAGAEVINLADTNGILSPEETAELVSDACKVIAEGASPGAAVPLVGIHCHDDLGLAAANSLAGLRAGASHVEVTVSGFGERAGNAALEEIAFLISAFGEKSGLSHGLDLSQIGPTARLFESLTGVRTHPNKSVIGQSALRPAPGGFAGASLSPHLRSLLREETIGLPLDPAGTVDALELRRSAPGEGQGGPYQLESFNVLSSSHSPPVGLVVIRREGKSLTQSSHGTGPIDALFHAVNKALGFSTKMVLYSVSTLEAGTEAATEVIVTVELRGRRFHGRYRSTDVIEASLRAYMAACNCIGTSGLLEGPSDFHVAGEYLWE
ncbi:MAG TPA: alpha-isopropylmalate synthase regulatory domain-containing protein [Spirochaetia bacterium]|nr:alpha-isopropylmalate synthase regulatory domain-containing protein [Spirochaetia bacterium]